MYEQEAPGHNRAGPGDEKTHADLSTGTALQVNESQAARLRAHLEAGRQFYNAVLSARLPGLHSHTNAIRAAALGEEGKR